MYSRSCDSKHLGAFRVSQTHQADRNQNIKPGNYPQSCIHGLNAVQHGDRCYRYERRENTGDPVRNAIDSAIFVADHSMNAGRLHVSSTATPEEVGDGILRSPC